MSFKTEMLKSFNLNDACDFESRRIDASVQAFTDCGDLKIRFTPLMVLDSKFRIELYLPTPIRINQSVCRMIIWNGEWYFLIDESSSLPAKLTLVDK